jgi:hypothetical protein
LIILVVAWVFQYVFAALVGLAEEKANKNMNY